MEQQAISPTFEAKLAASQQRILETNGSLEVGTRRPHARANGRRVNAAATAAGQVPSTFVRIGGPAPAVEPPVASAQMRVAVESDSNPAPANHQHAPSGNFGSALSLELRDGAISEDGRWSDDEEGEQEDDALVTHNVHALLFCWRAYGGGLAYAQVRTQTKAVAGWIHQTLPTAEQNKTPDSKNHSGGDRVPGDTAAPLTCTLHRMCGSYTYLCRAVQLASGSRTPAVNRAGKGPETTPFPRRDTADFSSVNRNMDQLKGWTSGAEPADPPVVMRGDGSNSRGKPSKRSSSCRRRCQVRHLPLAHTAWKRMSIARRSHQAAGRRNRSITPACETPQQRAMQGARAPQTAGTQGTLHNPPNSPNHFHGPSGAALELCVALTCLTGMWLRWPC
jgi:hypothetical protein